MCVSNKKYDSKLRIELCSMRITVSCDTGDNSNAG